MQTAQESDTSKFNTEKLDPQLIRKNLVELGGKVIRGEGTTASAIRFQTLLIEQFKGDPKTLDNCDCGARVLPGVAECPFCGDVDGEDPAEAAEAPPESGTNVVPEPEAKAAPAAKKTTVARKTAKKKPGNKKTKTKAKTVTPPSAGKKKKPKTKVTAAKRKKPNLSLVSSRPNASSPEIQTIGMLDEEVAGIRESLKTIDQSIWDIGRRLNHIREKSLYTLRKGDDGAPLYDSWKEFVQLELGMDRSTADKRIAVTGRFDRKTVEQVGVDKLTRMLVLKPEYMDNVLDKAKGGASSREIDAEIESLGPDARLKSKQPSRSSKSSTVPCEPSESDAPSEPFIQSAAPAAVPSGKVIVATFPEARMVSFMRSGKPFRRKLPSGVVATEVTEMNGITLTYQLESNDEDELVMRILSTREDAG